MVAKRAKIALSDFCSSFRLLSVFAARLFVSCRYGEQGWGRGVYGGKGARVRAEAWHTRRSWAAAALGLARC
ncbi:hypothetical protein ES332_D12G023600v1 [Gossypium tomentosum]|uniref:Uncharacterized protein n=1 Tax=Gossypium tomentosum TaxID=34277 RepID=A0A5D2I5M0_GOSTO|nr:hypothetical protein ES332_D12G023600v1 [Gossypium tomentosum]